MVKSICKCIVNSQNVLKLYVCSNIQFHTVCREFSPLQDFSFLQHLAVDVTPNLKRFFRLDCFGFILYSCVLACITFEPLEYLPIEYTLSKSINNSQQSSLNWQLLLYLSLRSQSSHLNVLLPDSVFRTCLITIKFVVLSEKLNSDKRDLSLHN